MNNEYVFNDKRDIVSYIYNSLTDATPLKLQKTLYFLWAFYAATYGNIIYDANSEFDDETKYPKELFKPAFEAWRYGPVDNEVYGWDKSNKIKDFDNKFGNKFNKKSDFNAQDKEIKLFMDDLINQIDSINDFGLVNRSHEDSAYKDVYKDGGSHIDMIPEEIKKDYIAYVKKQSEI